MTSQPPTITSVPTYADEGRLRDAIAGLFAEQADVCDVLAGASPVVVVKPNWLQESHEYKPDVWEPVITHPNVVMAVVEQLAERMGGRGTLCLCDAPHTYANFDAIVRRGGLRERLSTLRAKWPRLALELIDLRREIWIRREEVVVDRRPNIPDPRGYVQLNLSSRSLFYGHRGEGRYYGADYDTAELNRHHRGDLHEYLLAGTPMSCDLFVNVPKLKTHKKTGISCCLKNLVGINGDKNWLPHHTLGSIRQGGDEVPAAGPASGAEQFFKRVGQRAAIAMPGVGTWAYRKMRRFGKQLLGDSDAVVRNGNWHGNDTCWRMALDLNRALLYGNCDGTWRDAAHPKMYLAIVDGIVGGEGNGPLCPDPVESGVLVSGRDPGSVDAVAAQLMGFSPELIPLVSHAFDEHCWPITTTPLSDVTAIDHRSDGREIPATLIQPAVPGGFKPHFGWRTLGGVPAHGR